jgi:hypothetical protein
LGGKCSAKIVTCSTSRDLTELSTFCLTMSDAYPSDSFFMKFHASSRVIRVQSVLFTERISSPTFSFSLLSAAPPGVDSMNQGRP